MKKPAFLAAAALLFSLISAGQVKNTIAEKLGYPSGSKLLIIHADDMGMSHSTNMACIEAYKRNAINSGSVMVPCPWFPEMAAFLKDNPGYDTGIHLTFTSEWKYYKWNGVLTSGEIGSLLDSTGSFYTGNDQLMKKAKKEEIIREVRAQIDKALEYGIKPSHIDTHTGSLLADPAVLNEVMAISKEYGLMLTIPMNMVKMRAPYLLNYIPPDAIVVDNFLSMYGEISNGDWTETYRKMIDGIKPGLNELIFHLSYDNDEMKAIAVDHEEFGSAWRGKDLDFVLSDEFQKMLEKNGVVLVTWREIQQKVYEK